MRGIILDISDERLIVEASPSDVKTFGLLQPVHVDADARDEFRYYSDHFMDGYNQGRRAIMREIKEQERRSEARYGRQYQYSIVPEFRLVTACGCEKDMYQPLPKGDRLTVSISENIAYVHDATTAPVMQMIQRRTFLYAGRSADGVPLFREKLEL